MNISSDVLSLRFKLIERRGIRIPLDAAPCCCPANENNSNDPASRSSPVSLESTTDSPGLLDSSDDIDFSDLPSLDVASPFSKAFGSFDINDLDLSILGYDDATMHPTANTLCGSPDRILNLTNNDNGFFRSGSGGSCHRPIAPELATVGISNHSHSYNHSFAPDHSPEELTLASSHHQSSVENCSPMQSPHRPDVGDSRDLSGLVEFSDTSETLSGSTRTVITLDNMGPDMLSAVMNIIVRSRASVRFEMIR